MAAPKVSVVVRQEQALAIVSKIDSGSTFKFYTASQPAGPGTAISSQTLLATLACSSTAATATAGVITFAAITQDSAADTNGTTTWVRLCDSTGAGLMDFDVTDTAGTGAVKINTTTIVAGGPVAMSSFTITVPGA